MHPVARAMAVFTVLFHVAAFILESVLWMNPVIYETVLGRLALPVTADLRDQALILKPLFVNQGFYNLFLALAGVTGLVLLSRGNGAAGYALIGYMCLSAVGAGLVLALTTAAYTGAVLQALPPAVALGLMASRRSTPG